MVKEDGSVNIGFHVGLSEFDKDLKKGEQQFDASAARLERRLKQSEQKFGKSGDTVESDFTKNMNHLEDVFDDLAKEAEKSFEDIEKDGKESSNSTKTLWTAAAVSIGTIFADIAKSVVSSFKNIVSGSFNLYADFDDSMRQVQATMGLTGDEGAAVFAELSAAAREAGATTRYTASDAADALNYMALAGYDAEKAMKTMPKVLQLAAAGNLDIAYTSDMVTDAMSALQLPADDLDKLMNEMAKTAQRTNTSIGQLGEAILTVGGQIPASNQSIESMNLALGLLANTGLKASEAGTALRNILSLSKDNADDIKKMLGVDVYDQATGEMRDIIDIMGDMNEAMKSMSAAERDAFLNSTFGLRNTTAALNLMGQVDLLGAELDENGVSKLDSLREEIGGALGEGVLETMSETMEGGIGGAIRQMISLTQELMLTLGDAMAPIVQEIIPYVKDLFNDINAGMQKLFSSFSDEHMEAFRTALSYLFDMLKIIFNHIFEAATIILPLLADAFVLVVRVLSPFWDLLKKIYSLMSNYVLKVLQAVVPILKTYIEMFNEILDYLQPLFDFINEQLGIIVDGLTTLWETAKKALKVLGMEFDETTETVNETKTAIEETKEAVDKLDGSKANIDVVTNYSSTGSAGGGFSGGSSGGGGGGSGAGADRVFAGTGYSYHAEKGYYDSKTGASVSEQTVKDKFNSKNGTNFHTGGIIPGGQGQDVPTVLQAGEMVLTKQQQNELFNLATGNGGSGGGGVSQTDLIGMFKTLADYIVDAIANKDFNVNVTNKNNGSLTDLARQINPYLERENTTRRGV